MKKNTQKLTYKEMVELWLKTNKPSIKVVNNLPFPHLPSCMRIKENA